MKKPNCGWHVSLGMFSKPHSVVAMQMNGQHHSFATISDGRISETYNKAASNIVLSVFCGSFSMPNFCLIVLRDLCMIFVIGSLLAYIQ
jgi:hypothetical protein